MHLPTPVLSKGWLEPLLDRIARNSTTVVCPVIDVIDEDTLAIHFDKKSVQVGGFDWGLQVKTTVKHATRANRGLAVSPPQ